MLRSIDDLHFEEWLIANRSRITKSLTPQTCRFCKGKVAKIDCVCPHCHKKDPISFEERCSFFESRNSIEIPSIRKGDLSPAQPILQDIHACMIECDIERLHFALGTGLEFYYRNRDSYGIGPSETICHFLILLAPMVKVSMENTYGVSAPNPGHHGYYQLAIIREKQDDFSEAIRLCLEAKLAGWSGDWDERIARIRKKLAKKPYT